MEYYYNPYNDDYLAHFGVKGMKWGVRRYADKNGKLNAEGKKRYGVNSVKELKAKKKEMRSKERELNYKARKKYKLDTYEAASEYEAQVNRQKKEFAKEFWGDEKYADTSSYHQDNYDKQSAKAKKYVDSKMKKEFGQSYDTWSKNRDTAANIAAGAAIAATLGMAISMH